MRVFEWEVEVEDWAEMIVQCLQKRFKMQDREREREREREMG